MRTPRGKGGKSDGAATVTILSASPIEEDHSSLKRILTGDCHWANSSWILTRSFDVHSTIVALEQFNVSIVFCETQLTTGTWRDVLSHISALDDPPLLIVTSRRADERLWVEALNVGAFDVLSKPYDTEEVKRATASAWEHWQQRHGIHREHTEKRRREP